MKFTKPTIGTITLTSCLFDSIGHVDIKKLATLIDIENITSGYYICYIECYIKDNGAYSEIIKGVKIKKNKKYDPKKDKHKNRPGFSNSMTIDFKYKNEDIINKISVKIATNGNIECAGLKSKKQIEELQIELIKRLKKYPEVFDRELVIGPYTINMITYSFRALDDNDFPLKIDNNKLYNYVKNEIDGIKCTYETLENAYLGLFSGGVIYYIFQSAKINVTAVKSFEAIDLSYQFINDFITDNISNFIMTDYVGSLLKKIKGTVFYKQKSKEWLEQRVSKITATELSVVLESNPFSTITQLIAQKKSILNGEIPPSCPAMEHGNIFEPLAKKIYETTENAKGKRNIMVFEELSLMQHDTYPFLAASLDSIVFVTKNPSIDATLDDLITLYDKGEIYDAYVLEIKCPLNYHEYNDDEVHVPYVMQVQLQLDVVNLNYAVLLINKFIKFGSFAEYIADDTPAEYYGIVMKNNNDYVYPQKKISSSIDISAMQAEFVGVSGEPIYWKFIKSRGYEIEHKKTWLVDNMENIKSRHEYIQSKIADEYYSGAREIEL